MSSKLKQLMSDFEILICIGSGGVGKTTVSAALGVLAAAEGKKVLVLTIDPSKRLASTLGLDKRLSIGKVPGQNFAGELYAGVVDHKKTFDDFVKRAAGKADSADRILKNELYQQLSTSLSGSQEFTALEMLYSCHEKKEFDLIILDTPPAQHAIEFLKAPQKLAALFNEGIAKWFRDPKGTKVGNVGQLLHSGTKRVLQILETLTGSQFIKELADFFLNIEKWQGTLEARTHNCHRLLVHPKTAFVLVSAFDHAKILESQQIASEIQKGGYNLTNVVLNRAWPKISQQDLESTYSSLAKDFAQMQTAQKEDLRVWQEQLGKQVELVVVPENSIVHNQLSGLKELESIAQEINRSFDVPVV